jgi:hypothetical protein
VFFLPRIATLCGAQFLSHTFVATTLAKIRLGKLCPGIKQALKVGPGALVCQKIGNYPKKDQSCGHNQNIGRVHFGSNPNNTQRTSQD